MYFHFIPSLQQTSIGFQPHSEIWVELESFSQVRVKQKTIFFWNHDLGPTSLAFLKKTAKGVMKSIQNSVAPPVEDWLVHQNDKRSGGPAISADVCHGPFSKKSIKGCFQK